NRSRPSAYFVVADVVRFSSSKIESKEVLQTACSTFFQKCELTFQFEKLLVYRKAFDFADNVCSSTEQFRRGYGFLVDQPN
ncbi:MAG TPA: hypothetical protein PKD64_13695, partial [Pirellulaceae bacterium]|nr:hypothetical protein [Pirellulaceae bacterium]